MTEPRRDVRNVGRRLLRRSAQGVSTVRRTVARRPRLFTYLAILGPGVITATAGNDAGGIATYASAGAEYGYALLWTLIPITISLGLVQEMCARMGAVTGKGLSDLIRERFGVRWTTFVMLSLLIANGGVTISEFVGIAAATELLGIPRYISVPLAAVAVWWLVVKGTYKKVASLPQLHRHCFSRTPRLASSIDWHSQAIDQPEFDLSIHAGCVNRDDNLSLHASVCPIVGCRARCNGR